MKYTTQKTAGEVVSPLTIREAAERITAAGICAERTARDWLYSHRVPVVYLQSGTGCKIWIEPTALQDWIKQRTGKGGAKCK